MKRLLPLLLLAACAGPIQSPAPPPAMQLRPALPVRVDGVLYEVRRTEGGVAVAGLTPGAAGQAEIARAAVLRLCGTVSGPVSGSGAERAVAVTACPALDI